MKYAKLAMGGAGVLAAVLSVIYGVLSAGTQGIIVLVAALVPAALVAFGTVVRPRMPRWASIVSAIGFLVVAMKTRQGDDLKNIMVVAFVGMLLAIALAIRPERDTAP